MEDKKKLQLGLVLYILIIGIYIGIATTSINKWEKDCIDNYPTVYITKTGVKYHKQYHYSDRNSSIPIFKASEKNYTPCGTCKPIELPDFPDKPSFYLYYWGRMLIGFSFLYWILFIQISKE